MRWYILLAFVSLAVLILTEESEGWWRRRRSSRRRSSYRPPPRYYRRRSISYTRRRRSVSRGCGYLYCYNGGTKYCAKGWWTSKRKVAKCRCRSGTSGKQCQTITCPRKSCKNGGTNYCKSRGVSACRCPSGFSGSVCQYGCARKTCYNGGTRYCSKGGFLSWGRNVAKCRCKRGWKGHDCRIVNCPHKDCKNGGKKYCRYGYAYCRCRHGNSGSKCQHGCPHKKCYNGGKRYCNKGFLWGWNVAKCRCPRAWKGHDCRIATCPQIKCQNGGAKYCRNGSAYCRCRRGFSGSLCQNGCPYKLCFNGGKKYCTRAGHLWWRKTVAKCRCATGWHGHYCHKACPSFYCKHGKVSCTNHFWVFTFSHCVCNKGWKGKHCDKPKSAVSHCKSISCKNGGTKVCVRHLVVFTVSKCRCTLGYYGKHCEKVCPKYYCKHGKVSCTKADLFTPMSSHCICDKGWKGKHCNKRHHYKKVCFKRYGCFDNSGPFNRIGVPLPKSGKTTFTLFTKKSSKSGTPINDRDGQLLRKKSSYDRSKQTIIIIHGWRETVNSAWITEMTKELIKKDVNVIVVGWNSYSSLSFKGYFQSVANTRLAGSMVAELIKFINRQMGNTPASFHLIGFSLGAHVAGYVGKRLKNVARITGLDPAGPWFQGSHTDVKLDSSDAAFVDVIHTDSGHKFNLLKLITSLLNAGTTDKSGHLDFWPNGGNNQPGCGYFNVLCDHFRAPDLYVESITSRCAFRSYRCSSWNRFKRGSCMNCAGNSCPEMGHNAYKYKRLASGNFYLYTNKRKPFCKV